MVETTNPRPDTQRRVALALALWAFAYACYRAYYTAGGTIGMIGQPVSDAQFRAINAYGAAIILFAAILPLAAIRVGALRRTMPVLGWIGAVGCCMHALVDSTLRVLSLTGVHPTQLHPACGDRTTGTPPTCKFCCSTSHGSWSKASSGQHSASRSSPPRDVAPG